MLATAPLRLAPGVGVTGPIPRRFREEQPSGPFFLDAEGQRLLHDRKTGEHRHAERQAGGKRVS